MATEPFNTFAVTPAVAAPGSIKDSADQPWTEKALVVLVVLSFAAGLAARLVSGLTAPLWLDETFTGAIALRPDVSGLIADCLKELGGPLYYGFIWIWSQMFGVSNVALRIPSLVFSIAMPLLILWKGHPDRRVRMIWAAIAALWQPGFYYSTEARCYSLLFLLGAAQTISFAHLLAQGNRTRANWWAAMSCLLAITHTHTLIQTAIQGAMLLAIYRKRVIQFWPALLFLIPAAIWFLGRIPMLLNFTGSNVSWYRLLKPRQLWGLPELLFGLTSVGVPLAILVFCTLAGAIADAVADPKQSRFKKDEVLPFLASAGAIAAIVAIGFITPSFTLRYLFPAMPGFLFGVALWAAAWAPKSPMAAGLVAIYLIFGLDLARDLSMNSKLDVRQGYNWEDASRLLAEKNVDRVVFVWDNPTATNGDREVLGRVGAFFLHREGRPVEVDAVTLGRGSHAAFRRATLARTAPFESRQRIGVIFLGRKYDLSKADPNWSCQTSGGPEAAYEADVYTTVCWREPSSPPPATRGA